MATSNDKLRIVRVAVHGHEAEYFQKQLHDLVHPFTHDMKKQRRRFSLPDDSIVFVAQDTSQLDSDGKPKGVGSVAIKRLLPGEEQSEGLPEETQYGEIKRMVVLKEYQGTGVAVQLLEAAEEAGKSELGCQCILVETLLSLKPARRFYEKKGYSERAIFGVYHEEDSVCYEKWG